MGRARGPSGFRSWGLPDRFEISDVLKRLAAAGVADIADKVEAGLRLTLDDGVRLFECPDLLAIGWLANRERERRHGGCTYYNFNIRLEATNVCVASCLFCSFARLRPGDPGSYTMSLEQLWDKLRARAHQPADRSPRRQRSASRAAVRLLPGNAARVQTHPPGRAPEVLHRGRDCVFRGSVRQNRRAGPARADGGGPRLAARGRRRGVRGARAPEDLPRQVRRRPLPRHPSPGAHARHAFEHHDAVRAHRDCRRARRSHDAGARAAGRDRGGAGVHPAGVPSRQQSDAQAARRRLPRTRCACSRCRG